MSSKTSLCYSQLDGQIQRTCEENGSHQYSAMPFLQFVWNVTKILKAIIDKYSVPLVGGNSAEDCFAISDPLSQCNCKGDYKDNCNYNDTNV